MLGLLGKKIGMTQMFAKDGSLTSITVVQAGPCIVVQKKTKESDGYNAIQVGFGEKKAKRMSKAERMHLEKKNVKHVAHLGEFRTEKSGEFEVGQQFTVNAFKVGDVVDVVGQSKGKGFQGVIKRHGKHGGPMSHGSDFHRRTGAIGMRTWPGRIFKNTKLPGHLGDERVTIKNLHVEGVRPEDNVLLIGGSVPGSNNGLLIIVNRAPDFENRPEFSSKAKEAAPEKKEEKPKEAVAEAKQQKEETKEAPDKTEKKA